MGISKNKSRYLARKIWESHHKRKLLPGMHLHHADGNPFNNEISNLIECTPSQHIEFHKQLGDSIQENFIGRSDFFKNMSKEQQKHFRNQASKYGKLGLGCKRTADQRKHLRENSKLNKPIEMVDLKNGKIVCEYTSVKHASEELGIQRAHIRRVITGIRKSWKNHVFRYKELNNER